MLLQPKIVKAKGNLTGFDSYMKLLTYRWSWERVIIEILANIGMAMQMFLRGMPEEEKINQNIEQLLSLEWFQQVYSEHKGAIEEDPDVRYLIGWTKVDKVKRSEYRSEKLRGKILGIINNQ
ncbi:hypothetical protein [Bacillus sp. P14.5]|uniref:hypothetical protein n=1 Tax=Bacillus sp. P14.5 TaxID=1983400 RepID=UPI000DEBC150|nr:hypothetical protein [Bacillus sp. P14.5]